VRRASWEERYDRARDELENLDAERMVDLLGEKQARRVLADNAGDDITVALAESYGER